MTSHPVRRWLTEIGVFTAHPAAFLVLVVYAAAWLVFQRETFDWHALATLATWFMTLVIQRAEHRDTQALHAKLDELLRVHGDARNDLMKLDQKDPEDIEQHRNQAQKQNQNVPS
jgi:low affinity Fe/Cu permease